MGIRHIAKSWPAAMKMTQRHRAKLRYRFSQKLDLKTFRKCDADFSKTRILKATFYSLDFSFGAKLFFTIIAARIANLSPRADTQMGPHRLREICIALPEGPTCGSKLHSRPVENPRGSTTRHVHPDPERLQSRRFQTVIRIRAGARKLAPLPCLTCVCGPAVSSQPRHHRSCNRPRIPSLK